MDDVKIYDRDESGILHYVGKRPMMPLDADGCLVFDGKSYRLRDGSTDCYDEVVRVRREDGDG